MTICSVQKSHAGVTGREERRRVAAGTRWASVSVRVPKSDSVPWWTPAYARLHTEMYAREQALLRWEDTHGEMTEADRWLMTVTSVHTTTLVTCEVQVSP